MRRAMERRETVLEDGDLPRARRKLGRVCRIRRWRQRVVFRRWMKGSVVTMSRIGDPLTTERMPTKVRVGHGGVAGWGGRRELEGEPIPRIEPKPTAVGLREVSTEKRDRCRR